MIRVKLAMRSLPHEEATHGEPNRRLMAAVLRTAVDDYRGTDDVTRTRRRARPTANGSRKAIAYVTSKDRTWPFSFENLCEALGLDADCLRRELRKAPGVFDGTISASQSL
jgi:hypothetical protein